MTDKPPQGFDLATVTADLARYHGFGGKASGGPGDTACGDWLGAELQAAGYAVRRHVFEVPFFEAAVATLTAGDARAEVIPQAIVVPTPTEGIEAPLAVRTAWTPDQTYDGAIVLVVLPYRRWSTAVADEPRKTVQAVLAAGASAVVLVTTGPSGQALALNAPADRPLFDRPVAVIAPRDAGPLLAAAARGERGRLTITGRSGRRPAFNLVGERRAGAGPGLVLSTPRSGWFDCAGERGGGVAAWLALARWAPQGLPGRPLTLLATSGHEYESHGGEVFLGAEAPPPRNTGLWVHLGANVAARDWAKIGPARPLPSPDPQRVLMVSAPLVPAARRLFAGQPGLENVLAADPARSAGELSNILAHGYGEVAGVFGVHRLHHAQGDDLACTHPQGALMAAEAFRDLIAERFSA